ncbi:MAG: hypothetical protein AAGE80_09565 [Pseudomonadota bacterium]
MTHHAHDLFDDATPTDAPALKDVLLHRLIRRAPVIRGVWRRDRLYLRGASQQAEVPRP